MGVSITGGVVITGASILVPVDLATIEPGVVMPVSLQNATIEVGTVEFTVNIGTVDAVLGTVMTEPVGGRIDYIGTIDNAPLVTVQGTIANINATGTMVIDGVATGVTIPITGTVAISGEVGTLSVSVVGTVYNLESYLQTNIISDATMTSSNTTLLTAGAYQNLVVDVVYGTVVTGSIQTSIYGVEPQSKIQTSALTIGDVYTGTVQAGQRLVASAPLGASVAVVTTVTGTVLNVYITAEQST